MKALILSLCLVLLAGCPKKAPSPAPQPPAHAVADELKQPTPELATAMTLLVNEDDIVSFIEIVDVSLTANTRQVIWWYSDQPYLHQAFENFERTKPGKTAWLVGSKENVDRQLTILNTPYQCAAIKDTRLPIQVPQVLDYVTHLCVVPIPPEEGHFSGYLSVWLKREPTQPELTALITQLQAFSRQHAGRQ